MHDFVSWRFIPQSMGVFSFKHFYSEICLGNARSVTVGWKNLAIICGWNVAWTSLKQNAKLFEGIWCIKHGRIGAEKPRKGKKHIYLMETQQSPLKILKLKPTDKEQQLDYKKVEVGFVAQQVLKEKSEKFVWNASSSIQNGMYRFSWRNSF